MDEVIGKDAYPPYLPTVSDIWKEQGQEYVTGLALVGPLVPFRSARSSGGRLNA